MASCSREKLRMMALKMKKKIEHQDQMKLVKIILEVTQKTVNGEHLDEKFTFHYVFIFCRTRKSQCLEQVVE